MNSFVYWLSYRLGMAHWDSDRIPPEVEQAFQTGNIPEGPALDLGCGTGTNVIYLAKQGRQTIGIDFVPQAITKAKRKAQKAGVSRQTQFLIADVTRLSKLNLPHVSFALDMGCFHGLGPDGQRSYAQGLAEILIPGGQYMLYALDPRKEAGIAFGLSVERIQAVFSPWFEIERIERGSFWDRNSTWFWMRKKLEEDNH